jgi:glycosyltransferase involved in cell wall biosynthesis
VDFILFGSSQISKQSFNFPAEVLNLVPSLDELASLYSSADVGLVFSTTNPSLIPYEMMACGLPVVDFDRPGNELNYGNSRDNVFLASSSPKKLANQVSDLIDDRDRLKVLSANGKAYVSNMPDEMAMARKVESLMAARLNKRKRKN